MSELEKRWRAVRIEYIPTSTQPYVVTPPCGTCGHPGCFEASHEISCRVSKTSLRAALLVVAGALHPLDDEVPTLSECMAAKG